ncbi:MAG TPA: lipocalin-like domain-containing protein, partial [Longimicrobiales bacterium]|nr:lipocalin-like domain-containing protein [Longimicrobiales bacterium]
TAADGRELGYQLTFFRSALMDSASYAAAFAPGTAGAPAAAGPSGDAISSPESAAPADPRSAWRSRHAWMAHLAVSDATDERFHAAQRFARDAVGLAGVATEPLRVWLHSWSVEDAGPAAFRLEAADADVAIDLVLEHGRPVVLQGERGLSAKGPEPGNASYYYSMTRMPTRGTITSGGVSHEVTGSSWLDREWSTSALADGIAGWDWMALQLDDGADLMLYRLRRTDGTADPFSAGTLVNADGSTVALGSTMFEMTPRTTWRAPDAAAQYPVAWRVTVPGAGLDIEVEAAFPAQELRLAVRYWEGMVRVRGSRDGAPVGGRGYLEMTGYAARADRSLR